MDLDTDARVDAAITFYEDCSKEKMLMKSVQRVTKQP